MNEIQNWNLSPIWKGLLDIHEAIRGVCQKHNITYWAIGGTALGAMRHGGFIPWDDDFDIAMLRPDYEKFWRVAVKDLPKYLSWTSVETDAQHVFPFGKVHEMRQGLIEELKRRSNLNLVQGLYIDVFPIDGQPETETGLWWFKLIKGRLYWFLRHLPFVSEQNKRRIYSCYLKHIPVGKTNWVGAADADTRKKTRCYWPRKWFNGVVWKDFAGTKVPLPADPEAFIEKHYRNWRQLPPPENQVPSHQELKGAIVDF